MRPVNCVCNVAEAKNCLNVQCDCSLEPVCAVSAATHSQRSKGEVREALGRALLQTHFLCVHVRRCCCVCAHVSLCTDGSDVSNAHIEAC